MSDKSNEIEKAKQAPEVNSAPVFASRNDQVEELFTTLASQDTARLGELLFSRLESQLEIEVKQEISQHSGPIPSAPALEKYNEIIPNGADRIMSMAEKEQLHRHRMDNKRENRASWGVVCAFALGAMGFAAAAFGFSLKLEAGAVGVAGVALASLVGAFIYGTSTKRANEKNAPPEKNEDE